MVRHDDEIAEVVSLSVEMVKRVGDDASDLRSSQHALPAPLIQGRVKLFGKPAMVTGTQFVRKASQTLLLKTIGRIDGVAGQPSVSFREPPLQDVLRKESAVRKVMK